MARTILASALALFITIGAFARNLYIPAAGVAPGANDTLFRTDVRLFNPSTTNIRVTLHYLPQGMDGSNIPGHVVTVPARQMVVLDNVVSTFFHWPAPTVGAIRIDSNEAADFPLLATSRTYTDTPDSSGTYGQFIPALDASAAVQKSIVLHVTHSAGLSAGFRTNAGIMNPGSQEVIVTPRVVKADGTPVGISLPVTVPPMSMIQLPLSAFIENAAVDHAFIHFDSTGPVFTYASVVDNRTGDQFFVAGQEDRAEVRPLP